MISFRMPRITITRFPPAHCRSSLIHCLRPSILSTIWFWTRTLAGNSSDPDGNIILVRFLDGTNCIGELTNGDLAITWDDISPGTHVLSVVATDNQGASVATQPITITLQVPNLSPAVEWLAPEGGTILQSPHVVVLQVNASDPDGRVAQVEYFLGPDSVGIATNDPFQLTWDPQP